MDKQLLSPHAFKEAVERLIMFLKGHGRNVTRDDVYAMLGSVRQDRSRGEKGERRFLTQLEKWLTSADRGKTDLWESLPPDAWDLFTGLLLEPTRARLDQIGRANEAGLRIKSLGTDCPTPRAIAEEHSYALVGVGALNLDHIVLREHWNSEHAGEEEEFSRCFDDKGEHQCNEEDFDVALAQAGSQPLKSELGGSAFNVVSTIRAAEPSLALAYLGACGDDVEGAMFVDWLAQNNTTSMVYAVPERRTARCLSYMVPIDDRLERRLLTTRGANTAIVDFIERDFGAIADALSRARIVHITSIFDQRAPIVLAELIKAVRARNENIIISIDPGEDWCRDAAKDKRLWTLFTEADLLFANLDEFRLLGRQIGSDEISAARTVLARLTSPTARLVVKHGDSTVIFVRGLEDVECFRSRHDIVKNAEIGDATGSGDAFAGGFLLGLLSGECRMSDCASLGAQFAARRLALDRHSAPSLASIFQSLRNTLRH